MQRRKQFATLEEAFDALPEEVREHSLRVEKYADLIFMEVCASDEYIMNMNSRVRLRYENRTMIGIAARYHDIGKILVPEDYHWQEDDFTPEELALYRRHSLGGDQLAKELLRDKVGIVPMYVETVCEGVAAHHEWWDGSGSPKGAKGEDIPIVGRIVAVADALDHLLMKTRTETPVNTAMDAMMTDCGTHYDPVIMGLMNEVKFKIEKIFATYRHESRAIPMAPHIIRRKSRRPMWLQYRPILNLEDKTMVAVEADMLFRRGKADVSYAEAENAIKTSKHVWDVQSCFVMEACDMVKRMHNCEVGGKFVALNPVKGFWKKRGSAKAVVQLMQSIDADFPSIGFVLSGDAAIAPTANVVENCQLLREAGCRILYVGVSPEALELETVASVKATHVCIHSSSLEEPNRQELSKLKKLANTDVIVLGEGLDKHRHFADLPAAGIRYAYGELVGEYETENDFIAGELALVN